MNRFALFATSLFLLFGFIGCHTTNSEDSAIFLRLKNDSTIDFSSAIVRFPKAKSSYEAIGAGKTSDYHTFNNAYRYGYIEIAANDTTYKLQPTDYVGEQPLKGGHYTYELSLTENHLNLKFIRD